MEQREADYPRRLYPEGASNLDNKDINHTCSLSELASARDKLGRDVWNQLKEYPVGIIAKLTDGISNWSGRTVHYLLCRQLHIRKKEIWSLVVDQPIRFSLIEFGQITGLNIGPVPKENFEPEQCRAFWDELKVPYGVGPKIDELRAALEVSRAWTPEKRKWLGLLLLQAMGLYALHHNSRIPFESAKRVFDDDAMKTYPWGRIAFEVLVDSIKALHPQGGSYCISGLSYALLAWAYESVACFGELFGRAVDAEEIPLLRWGGTQTRTSFEKVFAHEIQKYGQVRVRHMVKKESLEDMFHQWDGEEDDPRLVNLITDIHEDRYVGDFNWEVENIAKKKSRLAVGVSECEPPGKKQNRKGVKLKEGDAAEGVHDKEERQESGSTAHLNNVAINAIIANLNKIFAKFDIQDGRLEKLDSQFTSYGSTIEALVQRVEHMENTFGDKVNALVEDRLKCLGVHESAENFLLEYPQRSVNSPVAKSSPHNLSGARKTTVVEEAARTLAGISASKKTPANISENSLGESPAGEDTVADNIARMKGKRIAEKVAQNVLGGPKKTLFADGNPDFVGVSPVKALAERRGGRPPKKAEGEEADARRRETALTRKQTIESRKMATEKKKQEKQEAELRKKQVGEAAELRKKQAPVRKKQPPAPRKKGGGRPAKQHVPVDDGEIADVTDRVVAAANELLASSDEEEEEKLVNERIRDYRERFVQIDAEGFTMLPAWRPTGEDFPHAGDMASTLMRNNIQPSNALYDPCAPADPDKVEKLMKFLSPFADIPLGRSEESVDLFKVIVSERKDWPDGIYGEAGWLADSHMSAYLRLLIRRSMRDPTPFYSDRIAIVDQWFIQSLAMEYTQFALKPKMFKFTSGSYADFVHGRVPPDLPTNKTWFDDVDHLYGALQNGNDHWVAFHVDLREEKIDCYDPIVGEQTLESERKMLLVFRPMVEMIPAMANDLLADKVPRKLKPFRFRRRSSRSVPQNTQTGDCGVYTLKFVECLALGLRFDGIHDENIQGLRVKMGAELLDEGGEELLTDMMKRFL